MEQKERALAHIEKIEWVKPIEGADNIELIGVLGWVCIAQKGEFQVGELAVYIEIDSKCPDDDERFAFLAAKHYKIKTMKLGKFKVFSQGLAMPISLFPELSGRTIGSDVTKELKITYSSEEDIKRKSNGFDPNAKYKSMAQRKPKIFKNPIVKRIMRHESGRRFMFFLFGRKRDKPEAFPEWIVKTDETRIENAPFYLNSTDKWVKTEKLDGTSCTYAVDKKNKGFNKDTYEFIVCSRNVRQADRNQKTYYEKNVYWEMADKYDIKDFLVKYATAHGASKVILQGECIGFVQGNPYKLNENEFYAFNLIIDGVRLGSLDASRICNSYGIHFVPIIDEAYSLPNAMEEMKLEADGYSAINPKVKREGFVYRSQDGQKSFKNVSREYLLKHS